MLSELYSTTHITPIVSKVALSLIGTLFVYGFYKLVILIYEEYTSSLRDLPGPRSPNFIYGNLKEIMEASDADVQERWIEEFGNTIQYKGLFGITYLFTTDLKALSHMLVNSYDYQKPEFATYNIQRVIGKGLLLVDGDVHKHQRRLLNPAFGPQQIREMTEIFIDKSIELRDIWTLAMSKGNGVGQVDALGWLARVTLDVIGLAGFGYDLGAMKDGSADSELSKAISTIFKAGTALSIIPLVRGLIPALRFLPAPNDAEEKRAANTLANIGSHLLNESKTSLAAQKQGKSWDRRDVLSLLVRANSMPDVAERMTDQDVLSQIPTFLVAGHESTSVGTTWALYCLTQHKDVQANLRAELSTIATDNPTMDDFNSLHYLDAVVRETLRLYPPAPISMRVAMRDDYLPLSKPVKDRHGVLHSHIRIRKGQKMLLSVALVNRDKTIWGQDAGEFKPQRWKNIPDAVAAVPGVWGNMLTFMGGPRACIGYRFAIMEMKALLFTLVRAFEIDLAVPGQDIVKKSTVVLRPVLATDPNHANKMPLILRPVSSNS